MTYDPTAKQPAFFPSVSAEIFFESEDRATSDAGSLQGSVDLERELDAILAVKADG